MQNTNLALSLLSFKSCKIICRIKQDLSYFLNNNFNHLMMAIFFFTKEVFKLCFFVWNNVTLCKGSIHYVFNVCACFIAPK